LVDPRWQKVRLEVFERDDWRCRCCGNSESELHAHHSFYEHGREPWEYPLDSIITYCHGCHEAEHGRSFAGDAGVLQLLRKAGFATVEERVCIASAFVRDGPALSADALAEIEIVVRVLATHDDAFRKAILAQCLARDGG
jgi:hypothetical protein